jgi:hypothetical protein
MPPRHSPTRVNVCERHSRAETEGFETSVSGGQHAHVKSCGQSVGTADLDDNPTSLPILLRLSESVSFPLNTIALNGLVCSGKPLTTAMPTSDTERDGSKRNGPDRGCPRRTSIWPKMAVTVGFEPKEARSISIRIDPNPRNSAACDAPGSAAVLSESARINIVCGHHVGTSNYVRAARRPVAAAGRTQRRRTTRPALAFGVDVMRRPV